LIELIPHKALYRPNDPVCLQVRSADGHSLKSWTYVYSVWDLNKVIRTGQGGGLDELDGENFIHIGPITDGSGAYGVFMSLTAPDGELIRVETAFDMAEHWREAPRYGFLSDFSPEEAGKLDDVDFLNSRHINLVQFYDWMYRHDRLLPDTETFTDPLGRSLSHEVVKEKIASLRERGIDSIAYAAVYGALPDYIEKHPEQGLYQNNGKTHSLGNYFHIMDISTDSAWTAHIVDEFVNALKKMGFDGLHLDQYGFPKKAIRHTAGGSDVVALKDLYPAFINDLREKVAEIGPDVGLIFNNVSNYPVQTTANAHQDVIYIEVWDPVTHLRDLKQIIDWARKLSGKQVVLAAYLPTFHPERGCPLKEAEIGATLTMATIFASGGYHLLLGEHENVLADSYYPKYGAVSVEFKRTLKHYYDFIVMYRNLLFDQQLDDISMTFTGGINTEVVFAKEGITFSPNQRTQAVWSFVKEKPGYLILQLINLCGVDNDVWHEGKKQRPNMLDDIEVKVELWEEIEDIYWATPDGESNRPQPLAYDWVPKDEYSGSLVRFTLPQLDYWSIIVIKTRAGVPLVL
jgi:dextranase